MNLPEQIANRAAQATWDELQAQRASHHLKMRAYHVQNRKTGYSAPTVRLEAYQLALSAERTAACQRRFTTAEETFKRIAKKTFVPIAPLKKRVF